ncbi:MAG: DUF211 domain-containing protein [Candidatus Lokiarchaeota archaeon]|nr:DUF211 domain-containing protein [Candidatus Lokiarchaeota archaeon]
MLKTKYNLDVLKPHHPSSDMVARALLEIEGSKAVRISVDELDQKTASLHIEIEGIDLSLDKISRALEELNCALHSVDEVVFEKIDETDDVI